MKTDHVVCTELYGIALAFAVVAAGFAFDAQSNPPAVIGFGSASFVTIILAEVCRGIWRGEL